MLELSTTIQAINLTQVQLNSPPTAPVLLLLHSFPASSFQFREPIPLASKFRVLVPDLPTFGFTEVPAGRNCQCMFDSLSVTIEAFLDALNVQKFAVYVFDYGVRTLFPSLPSLHCVPTLSPSSNAVSALTQTKNRIKYVRCSPRRHSVSPCGTPIA